MTEKPKDETKKEKTAEGVAGQVGPIPVERQSRDGPPPLASQNRFLRRASSLEQAIVLNDKHSPDQKSIKADRPTRALRRRQKVLARRPIAVLTVEFLQLFAHRALIPPLDKEAVPAFVQWHQPVGNSHGKN